MQNNVKIGPVLMDMKMFKVMSLSLFFDSAAAKVMHGVTFFDNFETRLPEEHSNVIILKLVHWF